VQDRHRLRDARRGLLRGAKGLLRRPGGASPRTCPRPRTGWPSARRASPPTARRSRGCAADMAKTHQLYLDGHIPRGGLHDLLPPAGGTPGTAQGRAAANRGGGRAPQGDQPLGRGGGVRGPQPLRPVAKDGGRGQGSDRPVNRRAHHREEGRNRHKPLPPALFRRTNEKPTAAVGAVGYSRAPGTPYEKRPDTPLQANPHPPFQRAPRPSASTSTASVSMRG
jgi:hypothetical protein